MNKKQIILYIVSVIIVVALATAYVMFQPSFQLSKHPLKSYRIPSFLSKSPITYSETVEYDFNTYDSDIRDIRSDKSQEYINFIDFLEYGMKDWDTSNWKFENDYVFGKLRYYNEETKTAQFDMIKPDPGYIGLINPINVTINCDEDKTIILNSNREIINTAETAESFFIVEDPNIYTKCLISDCSELGNVCAVVAYIIPE